MALTKTSGRQAGSILLGISLIIFLLSLAAAGAMWYVRQRAAAPHAAPEATLLPSAGEGNVLNPAVTIDEALTAETPAITANLVTPLRQYYATRGEHPTKIAVASIEHAKYKARVELTMNSPDTPARMVIFLYDLSPWTPSMLDNNE